MYAYDTVAEAVQGLKQRGFSIDFSLGPDRVYCPETNVALKPAEFEITEFYRFEGPSDPADEAAVYAIEGMGQKGVLVTGFGISAEGMAEEMVEKLTVRPQART